MVSFEASSNDNRMVLSSMIQSRICRIHSQGSFQSSSRIKRDSRIDCGVKSGFSKGEKEVDGSARKYMERRASISTYTKLFCNHRLKIILVPS